MSATGRLGTTEGLRVRVTGAAGGIGGAICAALIEDGAHVIASDRTDLVARLGVPSVVMDVVEPGSVKKGVGAAIAVHGGLDALVHVPAVTGMVPFLEIDADEWRRVLAGKLGGLFLVGRADAAHEVEEGSGGSLTFVISQLARRPLAGKAHYVASKAGIEALVRAMALELSEFGIRVNALALGVIATRMALDRLKMSDEVMNWTLGHIPLGCLADAEEIAPAALLLVGTGARRMTRTTIMVDGDYRLR